MPKYLNSNSSDTYVDGVVIPAGKTYETTRNFITLPTGVTKISDLPCYNPCVVSEIVSGSENDVEDVEVPTTYGGEGLDTYYIKVLGVVGSASISFNGVSEVDFGESILVVPGESHSWFVQGRKIVELNIKFLENSSKVKVDVSVSKV